MLKEKTCSWQSIVWGAAHAHKLLSFVASASRKKHSAGLKSWVQAVFAAGRSFLAKRGAMPKTHSCFNWGSWRDWQIKSASTGSFFARVRALSNWVTSLEMPAVSGAVGLFFSACEALPQAKAPNRIKHSVGRNVRTLFMSEPTGPILVVDDEPDIRLLIAINLRKAGYRVLEAERGDEALRLAKEQSPALILLDLMLPDLSGREVCRRLRAQPETKNTPVLMLTARNEEIDRVKGFMAGADDYVTKPFSVRELVLRVRAILRRAPAESASTSHLLDFGTLRVDTSEHRAFVEEKEVPLTATEFRLLVTLADRAGQVQSRGRLLQDVWEAPPDLNTRTVDTHVKRLREKLGVAADRIETVRGVGYRFSR
jgi:two-component system phosphate regulon response regulator PhoB